MPQRVSFDFDGGSCPLICCPVSDFDSTRGYDSVSFAQRLRRVDCEFPKRRHGVPVGLAIGPLVIAAVILALLRGQPETGDGEAFGCHDMAGGCCDKPRQGEVIGHDVVLPGPGRLGVSCIPRPRCDLGLLCPD